MNSYKYINCIKFTFCSFALFQQKGVQDEFLQCHFRNKYKGERTMKVLCKAQLNMSVKGVMALKVLTR